MSRPWAFLPAAASAAAGVTARVRRIVRKASGCSSREKQNAMEESKKGRNEEKRESERRDVWPWVSGSGRREASSCEWTINAIREARPYRSRRRLPPHRRQVITKAAASAAVAAAAAGPQRAREGQGTRTWLRAAGRCLLARLPGHPCGRWRSARSPCSASSPSAARRARLSGTGGCSREDHKRRTSSPGLTRRRCRRCFQYSI